MTKFALIVLAGTASAALAQTGTVTTTFADQDALGNGGPTLGSGFAATVQQAGIRGGDSGARFFNIQGRNSGNFASWGAIRFDLTQLYSFLNNTAIAAGQQAGDWRIDSVTLVLEESPAGFSANGGPIEIYRVANDTTNINPRTAGGQLGGLGTVLGGNRMYNGSLGTTTLLGSLNYTNSGAGVQETADISSILGLGELNGVDNFVTLVLDTNDRAVSATYKGQDSPFNGVDAPGLRLNYRIIPSPGAAALLGLGGLVASRRRRA